MAVTANIQSNSIRDTFKDIIVEKAIYEIHDVLKTVFGPYATDAYLMKDNLPYYTRDGKEVLNSLTFDSPVANYVKNLIYQAVQRQAVKVGDGTTTLTVFYTNLFIRMKEMIVSDTKPFSSASLNDVRIAWNTVVTDIIHSLTEEARKDISKSEFASMIYTCTQDAELTKKLTNDIADSLEAGAMMTINRSQSDTEVEFVVHDKPLLRATYQCSTKPLPENPFLGVVLFVNGPLNFHAVDTFAYLATTVPGAPTNVVLLCSGMDETTRNIYNEFVTTCNQNNVMDRMNNIIIMKLEGLQSYPPDAIEDLSSYVYEVEGVPGFLSPITYESLVYQSLRKKRTAADVVENENLMSFVFDPKALTAFDYAFGQFCTFNYSELDGLTIDKPLGVVSAKRLTDLKQQIDDEKSGVKRADLLRRLKSLYGQFVEVNVGSKLMKDEQLKYELVMDAVLSAMNAKTYGALYDNSIVRALLRATSLSYKDDQLCENCKDIIVESLLRTIHDMVTNKFPDVNIMDLKAIIYRKRVNFDLNVDTITDIMTYDRTPKEIKLDDDFTITKEIIEPLPIITELLSNSVMMVELAKAKMFNINQFIGNYL